MNEGNGNAAGRELGLHYEDCRPDPKEEAEDRASIARAGGRTDNPGADNEVGQGHVIGRKSRFNDRREFEDQCALVGVSHSGNIERGGKDHRSLCLERIDRAGLPLVCGRLYPFGDAKEPPYAPRFPDGSSRKAVRSRRRPML